MSQESLRSATVECCFRRHKMPRTQHRNKAATTPITMKMTVALSLSSFFLVPPLNIGASVGAGDIGVASSSAMLGSCVCFVGLGCAVGSEATECVGWSETDGVRSCVGSRELARVGEIFGWGAVVGMAEFAGAVDATESRDVVGTRMVVGLGDNEVAGVDEVVGASEKLVRGNMLGCRTVVGVGVLTGSVGAVELRDIVGTGRVVGLGDGEMSGVAALVGLSEVLVRGNVLGWADGLSEVLVRGSVLGWADGVSSRGGVVGVRRADGTGDAWNCAAMVGCGEGVRLSEAVGLREAIGCCKEVGFSARDGASVPVVRPVGAPVCTQTQLVTFS